MYVVSDVDFLQEVYIRQFSSFHSRRLPFLARMETGTLDTIFGASGAKWRRQRRIIHPTFTAAKLKLMSPLMNECIDAMLTKLAEVIKHEDEQINIYDLYRRLSMDVICKCSIDCISSLSGTDVLLSRRSLCVRHRYGYAERREQCVLT